MTETTDMTNGGSAPSSAGGGCVPWAFFVAAIVFGFLSYLCLNVPIKYASGGVLFLAFAFGVACVFCLCAAATASRSTSETEPTGYATRGRSAKMHTLSRSQQHAVSVWRGQYVDDLEGAVQSFYDFLWELNRTARCGNILNSARGMEGVTGDAFTVNPRLGLIVYCDIRDCYRKLGHDPARLSGLEGAGYAMLVTLLVNRGFDLANFRDEKTRRKLLSIVSKLYHTFEADVDIPGHENEFRFAVLFGTVAEEHEWVQRYLTLMYRWASLIAKADGTVTESESQTLAAILKMKEPKVDGNVRVSASGGSQSSHPADKADVASETGRDRRATSEPLGESLETAFRTLDGLVGLTSVKTDMHQLADFISIQRKREKMGLRNAAVSYHCVFTGNPGTGKTTVARILADIYRAMGVVKKGHLVETDRSGLVGEYVGQTAVKTNKVIDSALDGILFIDEAYTLIQGSGNDYGGESIATLLKRMEDDRERLVVILAGYTDEMKTFVESNPGLRSRFSRYVEFPDYTSDELSQIFLSIADRNQYSCDEDVRASIKGIMEEAVRGKDRNFGNGRFARTLFERTIQRQAVRLSTVAPLTAEKLSELTLQDLTCANG